VQGGAGNDSISGGSGKDSYAFAEFGAANADTVLTLTPTGTASSSTPALCEHRCGRQI